jgi:hypothetical protein
VADRPTGAGCPLVDYLDRLYVIFFLTALPELLYSTILIGKINKL